MPFEWSWNGIKKTAGGQGMEGYTPNGPSQNASAQMQNYNPNPAPMRLPQSINNPGQGAEYNFDATEINQYMRQEDEKKQRIASLEAQIANLEKSIMEKQAQLKNWAGVDNEIASIEASKINVADPTMVWRWNRGREDTKEANKLMKTDEVKKFRNYADVLLGQRESLTDQGIEQQIRNLETAIRDGNNVGAYDDVKRLMKRKAELEKMIYPEYSDSDTGPFKSGTNTQNMDAYISDFLKKNPSSKEISDLLSSGKNFDNNQLQKLNDGLRAAQRKEKNAANEKAFWDWAVKTTKTTKAALQSDPDFVNTLRESFKRMNGGV